MKRNANGFVVFENKREEVEYMRQWIKDHPGPWQQCPSCHSFYQSKTKPRPDAKCAQCRVMTKQSDPLMPNRRPGADPPKKIRGSRDRRDWADYH